MTSPAAVATLLDGLNLTSTRNDDVAEVLRNFEALSKDERESTRASVVEKIFPLVFGDRAAIQSSANYEVLKQKPWSTNCHLSPRVILTPKSTAEVSKTLTLCKTLGMTFSVRGGGHLQNPGFTSNDGGVVISLCQLKDISLSAGKTVAKIGPGLNWLEVYNALEKYEVTVTGGRVPSVGVSGLLLGGGLSFQNSEHGFSCMGVENYEIVLADGSVKNANKTDNADLFWALKGGCSNFGIVTRFDMAAVPSKVWAEARIYAPTANEQLIDALMLYHEAIEKDNKATLVMQFVGQATLLVFFYCEPVERPEAFSCFYDIPFLMNVIPPGCSTVAGVVQGVANVLAAEPQLHEMRTMASLPDLEVYKEAEKARLAQIESLKSKGVDVDLTMVFQPIASGAMKACDRKGGNPMGITSENHQWFLIMADWKNPKDEDAVRSACKTIVDKCEEVAKKNGTLLPFRYANYSSRDQNPLATYGEANLARLKEIALKYDPEEVFQKLQNGGWLVSRT